MAKPTPLVTSSESAALRDALGEARAALGGEADVQRLRAKLGELPAVTTTASGSGAAKITGLAKGATLALAGVVFIALAIAFVQRAPQPAAPATTPALAPVVAAPVAPAPVIAIAPAPVEPAIVQSDLPVTRKVVRSKVSASQAQPIAAPLPAGPKELELLMAAQDALDASPQRALGLLEQHAQLYPSGNFALEREALAIDTLRKLGRTSAAQARARAFIVRFPNAPSTKRLQSWLDESAATDHKNETQPLPTR